MSNKPQRTLRNDTIKNALKSFLVPLVSDRYFIIALRCLWDVNEDDLDYAYDNIWRKRKQCEAVISSFEEVVLFFSCLCCMESSELRRKLLERKKTITADNQVEGSDTDNDYDSYDSESLIPGISFWIATDINSVDAEKVEAEISKKLMLAGLSISTCKRIQVRGKGKYSTIEADAAALFQVLKDHSNVKVLQLAATSYFHAVRRSASRRGITLPEELPNEPTCEVVPAKLVVTQRTPSNLHSKVLKACNDIKFTRINMVVEEPANTESAPAPSKKRPPSNICVAVDAVERLMKRRGYSLCNGTIYKKVPEASFTSTHCLPVKKFLMKTLANSNIADVLTPHLAQVTALLSDPSCGLIKPLKINYNLIECLPKNTVFRITRKEFVHYDEFPVGYTPRAFVNYEYNKDRVPYPFPFVQGIQNSFPEEETRKKFLQKYYQLLLHGLFPMKEPKLLLEGDPNSGKTSWVAPFQGIMAKRNLAGILREGRFSGHLINDFTELVLMDEWTSDSLSCEDAKRILQGGMIMISQKHSAATKVNYNSGFFITTNEVPNFGAARDQEAILRRLAIFTTKTLPVIDTSTTTWLRRHCMDIFHYCAEILKGVPLFESCKDVDLRKRYENTGACYNDFDGITEKLVKDGDFVDELSSSESESFDELDPVTQEDVDWFFLQADAEDGERVVKNHPLFDNFSSMEDPIYWDKVNELANLPEDDWIALPIDEEDFKRYEIRRRNNWEDSDTFYDAWRKRNGLEERRTNAEEQTIKTKKRKRKTLTIDTSESEEDFVSSIAKKMSSTPIQDKHQAHEVADSDDSDAVDIKPKRDLFQPPKQISEVIELSESSDDDVKPKPLLFKTTTVVNDVIEILDSD